MACADIDMDIQSDEPLVRPGQRDLPSVPSLVQCYQADEMVPDEKGPLYKLLQKEPAVLGCAALGNCNRKCFVEVLWLLLLGTLQIISGLFSIGVGILSAVTHDIHVSLFTLFRVSQLTGVLFMGAGVVSNLLFKFPGLVSASFAVNCGGIVVGLVSVCLIAVDLADSIIQSTDIFRMEVMELCVLVLEIFFSAVLCFWFTEEKRRKSK